MSTDIEQELRGAMKRFTDDVRVPAGLAVKAYRQQQKRRVTTRAVAAAGTVTAAAATAVAVAGATGAFGSAGPTPAQATYTAYVVRHVQHALAASRVANLVEADRTVFPAGSTLQPFPDALVGSAGGAGSPQWNAGYSLRWIYHGSAELSSFTASGQRVFDWVITPAGRTTAVIYGNGTWWTAPEAGPGPRRRGWPCARLHPGPRDCPRRGRGQRLAGFHPVPAGLRRVHGGRPAGDRRDRHHQDHRDLQPVHVLGEPGELPARAGEAGAAPDRLPLAPGHPGQPGQAEGGGSGRLQAGPGAPAACGAGSLTTSRGRRPGGS